MAPLQTRKRKSAAEDPVDEGHGSATPTGSPARKKMKITQSQKQALIDNLQLEITERARHLRAHYALQASDLRSRIERRVNRIPTSLRKANMGELLLKYSASVVRKDVPALSAAAIKVGTTDAKSPVTKANMTSTASPTKGRPLPTIPQTTSSLPSSPAHSNLPQRQPSPLRDGPRAFRSPSIHIASDQENEGNGSAKPENLPSLKNPKRTKPGPTTAATRAASRNINPKTSVLSPKSHNSRTLPRSPIKDLTHPPLSAAASPTKQTHSYIARPISPLKPASPLKSAASAATSAISASLAGMVGQAKRGTAATARGFGRAASKEKLTAKGMLGKMAPPPRPVAHERSTSQTSNSSSASATSTSTTVVKKGTGKGGKATTTISQTTKKSTPGATAAAKKAAATTAAAKKAEIAEPAAGRRVLRKRT